MATEYMLTTIDNPFNPFTDFDAWFAYDYNQGYCSCAYLARVAMDSPDLSETERTLTINEAIDDIIAYDPTGLYMKVSAADADRLIAKNTNAHDGEEVAAPSAESSEEK